MYYLNKFIKEYIIKNKKNIILAYSGGLDSTVLLYLIMKWQIIYNFNFKIRAIHINHNLHLFSNIWSKHCENQCKQWNIKLIIKNFFFKKKTKIGIEALARLYRYNFFNKIIKSNEVLLTGHHIEDLSESFFLALKRGTGPKGLISIKFKRIINNIIVISPMLYWNKKKIKYIALNNNLKWIEDPTNNQLCYDRNYIRIKFLPILRNKWFFIDKLIARTSYICNLQEKILIILIKPILKIISNNNIMFINKYLLIKNNFIKYYLLRYWIIINTKIIPSFINITHIYNNVIISNYNNIPHFKLKNFFLIRYKYKLFILLNKNFIKNSMLKNVCILWNNINKILYIPYQGGIICNHINGLSIRKPYLNEIVTIKFTYLSSVQLLYRQKKCKINRLWKELCVLPWKRNSIPLLFYNDKLIAAFNFFITIYGYTHNLSSIIKLKWLYNDILQY